MFIGRAASVESNVLLLGETGVGKEVAARSIHNESRRKGHSFIKINCANLNQELFESEMFGFRKGSFTGAIYDRPGLFEEAHGGTLFIDEIGDCSPTVQAKFLSAIEDNEIRRLGYNRPIRIDVRLIFATNKNLSDMVKKSLFRRDLYYRINVLTFRIAPLRERKDDIPLFIDHILRRYSLRTEQPRVSAEAQRVLMEYTYPGNIRELENILESAILVSDGRVITDHNITPFLDGKDHGYAPHRRILRTIVVNVLERNDWNKSKTARDLAISRVQLYKILRLIDL